MKKANRENRPSHISKGNVLDDLGLSPEEAAALKLKMDLHAEVMKIVQKKEFTPRELEGILNQPQPRVSELLRGKLSVMSAEKLAGYLSLLGVAIKITSHEEAA